MGARCRASSAAIRCPLVGHVLTGRRGPATPCGRAAEPRAVPARGGPGPSAGAAGDTCRGWRQGTGCTCPRLGRGCAHSSTRNAASPRAHGPGEWRGVHRTHHAPRRPPAALVLGRTGLLSQVPKSWNETPATRGAPADRGLCTARPRRPHSDAATSAGHTGSSAREPNSAHTATPGRSSLCRVHLGWALLHGDTVLLITMASFHFQPRRVGETGRAASLEGAWTLKPPPALAGGCAGPTQRHASRTLCP